MSWNYPQCKIHSDVVGEILKCFKEDSTIKSRDSVIRELYKQNIIKKEEYEKLSKSEVKSGKMNKQTRDVEIGKLCEQLRQYGKNKCFDWVQQVLLETCYVKLQIDKRHREECGTSGEQPRTMQFKLFNQENNSPVMSPVSYHALLLNQSVPLVPWNCEQAAMCKDLKFLQLLHKLGFQMPVDTGKVFIRIPHVWSADVLYEVAGRVTDIDTTKLKFSITDITSSKCNSPLPTALAKAVTSMSALPENFYQIHKHTRVVDKPGSSFDRDVENETNKRCWLEVVQQSQELKLTCTVGNVLETAEEELAKFEAPRVEQAPPAPERILPAKDFIAQLSEMEDYNSDIETASVASDLTRMYVSDEDEKQELALRPRVNASRPIKEEAECSSGKRARV